MKLKYIVFGGLISVSLVIIGGMLKILHLPGANIALAAGVIMGKIVLLLGLIKVLTHNRFKDILNT
ncbi:hypothetical protein AB9P05_16465 [Roseivirga sp. BDSF3-8]|uniref:hypothetical protein n=1 Tax=Roseivirga sp. BDSF3-8 TaxID=3241598 RepID=UPI003531FBF3